MNRKTVILVNLSSDLTQNKQHFYQNRGTNYLNIGLVVVGTILRRLSYEVKVIDMAYDENYKELLIESLKEDVAFVGCSVMTSQVPAALEISKMIKCINEGIPVVWGGPHPTLFHVQTASNKNVDVAVVGEASKTLHELVVRLANRESYDGLKGVAYKEAGKIIFNANNELDDIEEIGELDHGFYDSTRYVRSSLFSPPMKRNEVIAYPILTGLGCCFSCKFCINYFLKKRYRHKQPQQIINEIKKLQFQYGANAFWFMDEDFFINKKRTIELFKLVEKEGLKFSWRCWVRVDHFKENYLDLATVKWLGNLGWVWSSMGAESGSESTLSRIGKGIKPEQTINSVKYLKTLGSTHWSRYSFIIGLPGEAVSDIKKTFVLATRMKVLNPRSDITIAYYRPYPGSPLSDELMKYGKLKYPDHLEDWAKVFSKEGFMDESQSPWILPAEQNIIKRLFMFFSLVRSYDDIAVSKVQRAKNKLLRLLSRIILWRFENNILFFPVEGFAFNLFKKIKHYLLINKNSKALVSQNGTI